MRNMATKQKPTNEELVNLTMKLIESEQNCGICHACGEMQDGCEPDARNYECESCEAIQVFGAEETLIMLS